MLPHPLMAPVVANLNRSLKLLIQANLHLSRRQLESAVDHLHINWGTAPAFVKKLQQALNGSTVPVGNHRPITLGLKRCVVGTNDFHFNMGTYVWQPFLREHCRCKIPFLYNEAKLENPGKIAYATDCSAADSFALRDGQNLAALSSAFQAIGTRLPPVPVLQRKIGKHDKAYAVSQTIDLHAQGVIKELLETIQTGHLATILDFATALPPMPSFVRRDPPRFPFACSDTDNHGIKNQFRGYSALVAATQLVSPDSFFNTGYEGIDKGVLSMDQNDVDELPVPWEVLLQDQQAHIERQVALYLSTPDLQEQFLEDLLQLLHNETQDDRGRLPLSNLEELWVVLAHSLTLAIMSDCPVVFALNATAAIADISAELKDDRERACFKVKQQFAHALVSLIYHTDHHRRGYSQRSFDVKRFSAVVDLLCRSGVCSTCSRVLYSYNKYLPTTRSCDTDRLLSTTTLNSARTIVQDVYPKQEIQGLFSGEAAGFAMMGCLVSFLGAIKIDNHGVKDQFQGYSSSDAAIQLVLPNSFFNTGYKGINKDFVGGSIASPPSTLPAPLG
ncbi:hypothetical protein JCM11251_007588 [Rhodosporidiobolus azoricus]